MTSDERWLSQHYAGTGQKEAAAYRRNTQRWKPSPAPLTRVQRRRAEQLLAEVDWRRARRRAEPGRRLVVLVLIAVALLVGSPWIAVTLSAL